jgi:hypothetical protein
VIVHENTYTDPEANYVYSIFNGSTPLGHDFGHVYTNDLWQQNVETPLGKFATKIFSE